MSVQFSNLTVRGSLLVLVVSRLAFTGPLSPGGVHRLQPLPAQAVVAERADDSPALAFEPDEHRLAGRSLVVGRPPVTGVERTGRDGTGRNRRQIGDQGSEAGRPAAHDLR